MPELNSIVSTETVAILIPTHNEALVIKDTLTRVFDAITEINHLHFHVLIFDSGSTDHTPSIVASLKQRYPQLHLLTEPNKTGLGSAYHQAMQYALHTLSADILIEFDADGSHQPAYLAPMLSAIQHYDVVLGSRYVPGGRIPSNWAWYRKWLSKFGNVVARLVLTRKYHDHTSGFRVTRRNALLAALPAQFISNHYAYKLELMWRLYQTRANILEYPITFIDRTKGQSKLPSNSLIDALRVLFKLRIQPHAIRYKNMCLIGVTGAIVQCLAYNTLRYGLSPFNASQCAALMAIINNFLLNYRFTFRQNQLLSSQSFVKSMFLYIGYSIAMIMAQSYGLATGITFLGSGFFTENAILLTEMIFASLLNYAVYSKLIWPSSKPHPVIS